MVCRRFLTSVLAVWSLLPPAISQDLSVRLNLSAAFNVKAASTGFGDPLADFDGSKRAYPVEWLPAGDSYHYSGVQFSLPPFHDPHAFDTVGANSQILPVPSGKYQSFHSLLALVNTDVYFGANLIDIILNFDDGTFECLSVMVGAWWSVNPYDGPIRTPYHYANPSLDSNMKISYNVTTIQYATNRISNNKNLVSIKLPEASHDVRLRIFSISLIPVPISTPKSQPYLRIENVRSTTKWVNSAMSTRVQQIEVTVSNAASLSAGPLSWITSPVSVLLASTSIRTVAPGTIRRLRSNDQVIVSVGVTNAFGIRPGTAASVTVTLTDHRGNPIQLLNGNTEWNVTAGIPAWRADEQSMATHEAPDWFDDAKFGIFVHYGLYSVPAWSPTGKQYAEWYNWDLHNPSHSPTSKHHLATYGSNITYDDFFASWTASLWNPDEWTDLFADSGAKYFILVTKHLDGIALFDTESSNRTSVKLGPKRNFLKELFASAKSRHPELRRGTYFSLPEWFNPAYKPHGHHISPGRPAHNAFTGECCDPYVGYIPVNDFLEDVQKPQMETLFYDHDTEILWCDIGHASIFPKIGADWYNYAASQGRQVVMNNRCGANQSDFVTPEYDTFRSTFTQKWESSEGMDPYSYGYNSDTPLHKYRTAPQLLRELVDIVSKGGNLLIDVGPKEDGTIISQMTQPLLDVGAWLRKSGEAIYGTRPWWFHTEDLTLTNVRFTTTMDAFYIIALTRPSGGLKVEAPVPIVPGDRVTLLGGSGAALNWSLNQRTLLVHVGDMELDMISLPAWAFKISYPV